MIPRRQSPITSGFLVVLSLSLTALAAGAQGADWPQWRGPDRSGVSAETGWSAVGKPDPLWTRDLGLGHSSFVTAGGKVYTMGHNEADGLDVVYCLDAESGKELWTHSYPETLLEEDHQAGTCTTPTLAGDKLYTSSLEGKVFSLNAGTGAVEWSRNVLVEHGITSPRWGLCGSPIVLEDTVVVNAGQVIGLDRDTGKTKWITEKAYGTAYSTPQQFDYLGEPAVLVFNGMGLAVINHTDGSEITFFSWSRIPDRAVFGATPMICGGRIFLSSISNQSCVMLKPTEDGLEVLWENRAMRSSHTGPVLYDGHIYGFDRAFLACIDMDGNTKWRQRGIGLGAMCVVGGRLLVVGAKGEIIIAEATPEKYIELSREKVLRRGYYFSIPVLSHGLIYVRNSLGNMVCLDYRGKGTAIPR